MKSSLSYDNGSFRTGRSRDTGGAFDGRRRWGPGGFVVPRAGAALGGLGAPGTRSAPCPLSYNITQWSCRTARPPRQGHVLWHRPTFQQHALHRAASSPYGDTSSGTGPSSKITRYTELQFSSVQFRTVSMRSGKPIRAPPRLSEVSPNVAFETVPMLV